MAFDYVAVDFGGVAGREVWRDAEARLDPVEFIRLDDLDGETGGPDVLGPSARNSYTSGLS